MKYIKRLIGLSICLILLFNTTGNSQGAGGKRRVAKPTSFLSQQWWLGFYMGANLSSAVPSESYSVFSQVQSAEADDKTYENYNKIGFQAGMEFTYNYKAFFFSFIPNYRSQTFGYSNEYEYVDADPNISLNLSYLIENHLNYIDLPLIIRYEFNGKNFRPYVLGGAFYGFLINANKSVNLTGTDNASGGARPFEKESVSVGATELYNSANSGILGGVGFNYYAGNIRTSLDITYRYGLMNITHEANRYSENRLAGLGDVMDDATLNNLSLNIGVLFPLRFLGREYKSKN